MRPFIASATLVCISGLLAGCGIGSKVKRELAEHASGQQAQYEQLFTKYGDVPAKSISWNDALRRMNQDNLQLRQSTLKLEQTRKLKSKEWKSLVPKIGSFVNVGSSISELSDLESDDINVNLVASMRIPNPFRLYGQLYSAALQVEVAEWSHQLDKRRAYTELYRAFAQMRELGNAREAIKIRSEGLLKLQNDEIADALQQLRSDESALKRREAYLRLQLNRLLNTPGEHWQPRQDMPSVSFSSKLDDIQIGKNFGKLGLNLQAAQIEGACLKLRQVKFQQWPQFNFSLGLPTIYSNQNDSGLTADDISLFSGASKQFDLTDIAGLENIQDTRRRLQFLRERLKLTAESETLRISQMVEDYRMLEAEQRRMHARLRILDGNRSSSPETVLDDLNQKMKIESDMRRAKERLLQYDLQFLIWDERHWK